jgi:hypothetical protein
MAMAQILTMGAFILIVLVAVARVLESELKDAIMGLMGQAWL